ncbi:hypothetical protein ACQP3J_30080, partial [Escherichia coli]
LILIFCLFWFGQPVYWQDWGIEFNHSVCDGQYEILAIAVFLLQTWVDLCLGIGDKNCSVLLVDFSFDDYEKHVSSSFD